MMKLFAVRDVKADAFGSPMSIATKGLALRSFGDACVAPNSELCRFPDDYMLYELGEYDPNSGQITSHRLPVFIISASDIVKERNNGRIVNIEPVKESELQQKLPGVIS